MAPLLLLLLADAPAAGEAEPLSEAELATYVLKHEGNAKTGMRLFEHDSRLACATCHRITGMERSGPNLDGIGDKYTRAQLVEHILDPSKSIAPGYEQTVILRRDGRVITGRLERNTKVHVRIIDNKGKQTGMHPAQIEQMKTVETSLMPKDSVGQISPDEFADLLAYLQTLRFGVKSGRNADGRDVPIPRLNTPVCCGRCSMSRWRTPSGSERSPASRTNSRRSSIRPAVFGGSSAVPRPAA